MVSYKTVTWLLLTGEPMFVSIVTTSPLRKPMPYSLCVSTSICVEAQLLVPLTRKFRNCQ